MTGLIWFHRDLRVTDHEGLTEALRLGGSWTAVVCASAEPNTPAGRFIGETIENLHEHLERLSISLRVVSETKIKSVILDFMRANPRALVFTSRRYNDRDQQNFLAATNTVPKNQIRIFDQGTLYRQEDLPFAIETLPLTFTPFQKKVEPLQARIREPLPSPMRVSRLGGDAVSLQGRRFVFKGGESAAHERLGAYLRKEGPAIRYAETRNGLLEVDDSCKISPYLAYGCISPRQVHQKLCEFEAQYGANPGTQAIRYELQWRDYFKFLSIRFGSRIFTSKGIKDLEPESIPDRETYELWCEGKTNHEFMNANLRELRETGWMSNRGRQNVASYFAKTLNLPWLWGAAWFEKQLIDFDVETNQGNWMYLAGVGTDPRNRVFNGDLQAQNYDAQGEYRKRWSGG